MKLFKGSLRGFSLTSCILETAIKTRMMKSNFLSVVQILSFFRTPDLLLDTQKNAKFSRSSNSFWCFMIVFLLKSLSLSVLVPAVNLPNNVFYFGCFSCSDSNFASCCCDLLLGLNSIFSIACTIDIEIMDFDCFPS